MFAADYPFARAFINSGRLSTPVSYPEGPLNSPDVDIWNGGVAPGSPAVDAPIGDEWLLDLIGGRFCLLSNGYLADIHNVDIINLASWGDAGAAAAARYDLSDGRATLFRPDQYVAARWHHPSRATIVQAYRRATSNGVLIDA